MLISQDEKASLRGTALIASDEVSVMLNYNSVPESAKARSPVLKCALESRGEATLPVTPAAFRLWLDHQTGNDESLEDSCIILKIATFLQDDATIQDVSHHIARAYRAAFRADTSSHRELFAVNSRRPADLKTDCFFPNFHDAFPRHPGVRLAAVVPPLATLDISALASVADHLCLYETLPGPLPLRAAALTGHLLGGCLDLFGEFNAHLANTPLHYTVSAVAPALALGVCPPVTALRVPAWALRRGECLAPLLPHLAHLRRLVIVGADGSVHSARLARFLAALAACGHPGLEALEVCTCRCSGTSPHPTLSEHPPKGPSAPQGSLLRGYLCIPAPPAVDGPVLPQQAVPPLFTALRSINLSISSNQVATTLPLLPLAALTRLRVCVFDRAGMRPRTRCRHAAAALAGLREAVERTSQLETLQLDMSLEHGVADSRPGLEALVAAVATCTTLRSLTLRPRWSLPPPFMWLLPLAALSALRELTAPPCFKLLQKLPELSALEFTAALDDVTPAMMHDLLALRHLRTLALINELTFDTYDVERSAHSEALDQLQATCAVIGSAQDVWSRSVEGFRRRGNRCHCWDPCGHVAHAAQHGVRAPSAVTMVVRGDTEEHAGDGAAAAAAPARSHSAAAHSAAAAAQPPQPAAGPAGAPAQGPPEIEAAIGIWPELGFIRGLRHVRLLVREPTNAHRDVKFWRAVAMLPQLETLEVIGLPGDPGLTGFLEALAGHGTLSSLVLHGKENHANAMMQMGAALARMPALREVCLDADMCDMHALRTEFSPAGGLGLPEEGKWEHEGVRHALGVLCERWKAALSVVILQQPGIVRLQARVRCTALAHI